MRPESSDTMLRKAEVRKLFKEQLVFSKVVDHNVLAWLPCNHDIEKQGRAEFTGLYKDMRI